MEKVEQIIEFAKENSLDIEYFLDELWYWNLDGVITLSNIFTYIVIDNNNNIKVGKSKNPINRIKQLKTANASDLKILLFIRIDIEKDIHKFLHLDRIGNSEWFKYSYKTELLIQLLELFLEYRTAEIKEDYLTEYYWNMEEDRISNFFDLFRYRINNN